MRSTGSTRRARSATRSTRPSPLCSPPAYGRRRGPHCASFINSNCNGRIHEKINMAYEEEIKKIEAQGYRLQGSFINEYGERYLIFNHHMFDGLQISGSETDWKVYGLADNGECAYTTLTLI